MRISRSLLVLFLLSGALGLDPLPVRPHRTNAANPPSGQAACSGAEIDGPYFSDQNQIIDRIVNAIEATRQSLDIAIYSITSRDIGSAIVAARGRGVRVRVVADAQQSLYIHSETRYLRSRGVPVRLSDGFHGERSLMHDKFAVFDGKLVETGSFNWTVSGAFYNFENAVFIRSPQTATRYEAEFERIWAQAHP